MIKIYLIFKQYSNISNDNFQLSEILTMNGQNFYYYEINC